MHYVNAYLWEIARLEPTNHQDRQNIINGWPALIPLSRSFMRLLTFSVDIRYAPRFQIDRPDLRGMIARDLALIAQVVEREIPGDE